MNVLLPKSRRTNLSCSGSATNAVGFIPSNSPIIIFFTSISGSIPFSSNIGAAKALTASLIYPVCNFLSFPLKHIHF